MFCIQRMLDNTFSVCSASHIPFYEKQLAISGFQLKGNGWDVIDFKGGYPSKLLSDG
jgi:predicted nucleic acid-binding Zn ribbon protein